MSIHKQLLFHQQETSWLSTLQCYANQHIQAGLWSVRKLTRMPIASFFSLLIISITLTLPVVFNQLLQTAQSLTKQWYTQETLSLYLHPHLEKERLNALQGALIKHPGVKQVRYIPPEQGLKALGEQDNTIKTISRFLDNNPLPGVLLVEPNPTLSVKQLADFKQALTGLNGVDSVQFDLGWLKKLHTFVSFGKQVLFFLALLLGAAVLLVISNTIQLSIQGHEVEMDVLELMGATRSYIRRPFIYTGIIMGLVGGVMAWMLSTVISAELNQTLKEIALAYGSQLSFHTMSGTVIVCLTIGGSTLGLIGAMIGIGRQNSSRLHLRRF